MHDLVESERDRPMLRSAYTLSEIRAKAQRAGLDLIGESVEFERLLQTIGRVARCADATVLIQGETGTGKELVARSMHYLGERNGFPFVAVNCGALPDTLAENELFGHHSGAFTGAAKSSAGLLLQAHRGTLFLDEVDSLSAKAQVALLRFLQDGCFRPLGSSKEERVDVRIIAASNRPLEREVLAERFRQDLYYRLNLITLDVPPLRHRGWDVTVLSQYFLAMYAQRYRWHTKQLCQKTQLWFRSYHWPGNVRELQHLIHREILLSDADELTIATPCHESLQPAAIRGNEESVPLSSYQLAKSRAVEEFHRTYLTRLLQQASGNVTHAAKLAGKERRALGRLLKRYGIKQSPGAALG
jgi:DNA-binding NtrC family response regulator